MHPLPSLLGWAFLGCRHVESDSYKAQSLIVFWVENTPTIAFQIPKELREFVDVASEIVGEADVELSSNSLRVRSMDASHIALVDLQIREESMEATTPVKTRLVLGMVAKGLKAGLTHLSYDTETNKLTMNGGARKFTIPTLTPSAEEPPTPKIAEFDVENLRLDMDELKAGSGLAPSDNVRIEGDGKTVKATLFGELATYEAVVGSYEGKAFKSIFNYNYLSQVFALTSPKLDAVQKWNFKSKFPVRGIFSKSLTERVDKDTTRQRTASLEFYLAPRIEAEDELVAPKVETPIVEAEASQAPVSA